MKQITFVKVEQKSGIVAVLYFDNMKKAYNFAVRIIRSYRNDYVSKIRVTNGYQHFTLRARDYALGRVMILRNDCTLKSTMWLMGGDFNV